MIRLIHTADVHIGRPFRSLGEFGRTVRAQIRTTFSRILILGRERGATAILIAGDLWDQERPDPTDVRFALEEIQEVAPIPVVLLPGTHDLLGPSSLYRALPFRPDNLRLFEQCGPQHFFLEPASLAIHGRANLVKRGGEPPLAGIRPHSHARYNIAVAHASIARGDIGMDPDHDYVVSSEEIEASGIQYLALGHWHKCAEVFPGHRWRAWYSGSPESLQFDAGEASGSVLEVTLQDEHVSVTQHPVGKYRWKEVSLNAAPLPDAFALRRAVEELAARDTIFRVRLQGVLPSGAAFEAEALHDLLAPRFTHLILDTAGLRTRWEDFEVTTVFPSGTVGAAFVELAQEKLRAASEADRPLQEEVLRRGTALLAGQEDVG